MGAWSDLEAELDAWAAAGRSAGFWWRDDDLEEPSVGLDDLLALRRALAIPVALAVVPASAQPSLGGLLGEGISVLQHGYDHADHAKPGEKKAELAAGRDGAQVLRQLTDGRIRLQGLFGSRFRPVLVPPWNRIDDALLPLLPKAGFTGLSAFAGRRPPAAVPQLRRADCHVDVIDWHGGRGFVGLAAALDQTLRALDALRRSGKGTVGVLTHHKVMDRPAWDFMRELAGRLRERGGHWIAVDQAVC